MQTDLHLHEQKQKNGTIRLILGFCFIIIFIGLVLSKVLGSSNFLYASIIIALFMNFFSYFFSAKIALSMNHAQPMKEEQNPEIFSMIRELSQKANIPMPKVYIVYDPAPNAFATGRNKNNGAIAYTTGILSLLSKDELMAVTSHELSHIANRDILVSSMAVVLAGCLSILANIFMNRMLFGSRQGDSEGGSSSLPFVIIGILIAFLAPLFGNLIQFAISRKREYLADASGAKLINNGNYLASALEKISQSSRPMLTANKATAHLFIANSFGSEGAKKAGSLFMTHPDPQDRIRILRNLKF